MKLSTNEKEEVESEKHRKEEISSIKFWNYYSYLLISFYAGFFSITDLAIQFFFKNDLKLEPGIMGQVNSLTNIPWMIKPLFGLLTDLVPICGYRRKYYIIINGLMVAACWFLLAEQSNTLSESVILLVIINVGVAFTTVLGEATVVDLSQLDSDGTDEPEKEGEEKRKDKNEDEAKDLVSSYFLIKYFGAMFSSLLGGKLVDVVSNRHIFLIASGLPALIVLSGIFIKEYDTDKYRRKRKCDDNARGDCEKGQAALPAASTTEKKIIIEEEKLDIPAAHNRSFETYKEMIENPPTKDSNLIYEFFHFITRKFVLIPLMFIILFMATPTYDDPFFYFLTNELKFNGSFLGWISFFSNLFTLIAIIIYKVWFKDVSFKLMIVVGSIVSFLLSFNSFVIVMRYNVAIGISDYVLTLFSSSMMSMIGELVMMPMLSLACILCPANLEGTVYAVFMSAFNFGGILSQLEGSFLTKVFNITSEDFTNLPKLIMVANFTALLPLPILLCINNSYFHPDAISPEDEKKAIADEKFDTGSVHTVVNPRENMGNPIDNDDQDKNKEEDDAFLNNKEKK